MENEFDVEAIEKAINKYKTSAKYEGLEEYEWNSVQTKGDKREAAK